MRITGRLVTIERIDPQRARRIVRRDEHPGDDWHPEYPFVDELEPLRSLAVATAPDPVFTMYLIRAATDGSAVGGIGFFGPPDEDGCVEFGYGLVPSARGRGLASDAVGLALALAADNGARRAVAETAVDNLASQRVLAKAGLVEEGRDEGIIRFGRRLGAAERA